MLSAQRVAPLAVALLMVLAGCGAGPSDGTTTEPADTDVPTTTAPETADAPSSTTTPDPGSMDTPDREPMDTTPDDGTETPDGGPAEPDGDETTEYSIPVKNGSLSFDVNRTFARVQGMLGTDVEPRPVEIRNLSEWRQGLPRIAANPLNDALGFRNVSVNWSQPSGATRFTGYVYIHPGAGSPAKIERVLAHEFTHTIQYQANMLPWLDRLGTRRIEIDQAKVYRALQEGGASYVADVYTHRYLDVRNYSAFVREQYEQRGATYRSALAPYLFGKQYVAHVIDSPANLTRAYQSYPKTTEQLLHNYTRAEEPAAPLSVAASAPASDWQHRGNNTLGEMTTRHSLGTELSPDRAAAAAAGWGSDTLTVFQRSSGEGGWVWVHRWDNSTEADEAFAALEEYQMERQADGDRDFRVVRVSVETTALVFGPESFVDAVSVEGTTANVTVQVGT